MHPSFTFLFIYLFRLLQLCQMTLHMTMSVGVKIANSLSVNASDGDVITCNRQDSNSRCLIRAYDNYSAKVFSPFVSIETFLIFNRVIVFLSSSFTTVRHTCHYGLMSMVIMFRSEMYLELNTVVMLAACSMRHGSGTDGDTLSCCYADVACRSIMLLHCATCRLERYRHTAKKHYPC